MARELSEKEQQVFDAFNHFAEFYRPATGTELANIDLDHKNKETKKHAKIIMGFAESDYTGLMAVPIKFSQPASLPALQKHKNFDATVMLFKNYFNDSIRGLRSYLLASKEKRPKSNFSYSRHWCGVFAGRPGQKIGIAGKCRSNNIHREKIHHEMREQNLASRPASQLTVN